MTNEQEEQLIIILSDFIPIMDGDRVQGVLPNAKDLTRQKSSGATRGRTVSTT